MPRDPNNDSGHSSPAPGSTSSSNMFESSVVNNNNKPRSTNLDDLEERSRGAYSTASKLVHRSSKSKSRSNGAGGGGGGGGELPKERKASSDDMLGTFFGKYLAKENDDDDEGDDDDRSRGAYSTVSKMRRSKSKSRSSSSKSVSGGVGRSASASESKDRHRSKTASSRDESKKSDKLSSLLQSSASSFADNKGDDDERSTYSGTLRVRRKRPEKRSDNHHRHIPNSKEETASSKSKDEMLALFKIVSSPSDFLMTDKITAGAVHTKPPKVASDRLDMDKILGANRKKGGPEAENVRDRSIDMLLKIAGARSKQPKAQADGTSTRRSRTVEKLLNNSTGTRRRSRSRSADRNSTRSKSRNRRHLTDKRTRSKSRSRKSRGASSADLVTDERRSRRSDNGTSSSDRDRRRHDNDSHRSNGENRLRTSGGSNGEDRRRTSGGSGGHESLRTSGGLNSEDRRRTSGGSGGHESRRASGGSSGHESRRSLDSGDHRRSSNSGDHRPPSGSNQVTSLPSRQKSSRRLVSKEDGPLSPHKSSRRLSSKEESSTPLQRQKSSRRLSPKEEGSTTPRHSKHSISRGSPRRHEGEERSPRVTDSSVSPSVDTLKLSNRHKQASSRKMVIDAPTPILEDEEATPVVNYFEQDIFSVYSWSAALQSKETIQRERMVLKDSIRGSPLFCAFPQQCMQTG